MSKKAKKQPKFLPLEIGIYRLHVVVTWETTAEEIAAYAAKHNCRVASHFTKDFKDNAGDALGLCMSLSNDSSDVLVWLDKKPSSASSYATLYHELYHAVDSISKSRNLGDEQEARAYLFEYLAHECNKAFWPK